MVAAAAGAQRAGRDATRAAQMAGGYVGVVDRPPTATDLNIESVREAAERLDITVDRFPGGFLKLKHGDRVSYSHGSNFAFESLVPYFACGDKWLTSTRLSEAGLPVPRFAAFGLAEYGDALSFLHALAKPVVTKPARGTAGGAGVTLGIASARSFRKGFLRAASYLSDVMVEEQVDGQNVRVTILDGRVLGAVHRVPAYVTGDGVASVAALIEDKNHRWRLRSPDNRLLRPIQVDQEIRRLLTQKGLELTSIPEAGQVVGLRQVSNADQGGEIVDVTDELHDAHLQLALAAARTLGPVLSAVDLITADLRRAAYVVVNEVNTTPGLYVANGMRDGSASTEASERILRYLFGFES